VDPDARVAHPELAELGRQVDDGERLDGPDRHLPARQARHRRHFAPRRDDVGDDPVRLRQQRPPGLGQRDPPRGPVEQRRAQFAFELPDRRAQRRLHHVHILRGAGETAAAHHREEVLHLPQLHPATLVPPGSAGVFTAAAGFGGRAASGAPCAPARVR
jgi:hypothetical protein